MDCPVFDPRREEYKKPYGAVPCETVLTVTVRPLHTEDFVAAALIFQEEFAGTVREIPLTFAGAAEDRDLFTGSFPAPEEPELGWYRFRFRRRDGGIRWMGKNGYGGEEVTSWQQTVYDGSRPTPGWFGEGVTYQIFPDRFRRTFIPDPRGMLGDRWVHQGWEEPMVYLPDGNGEIRNRDFFGGNLQGVEEKLDYLYSLGVTTLYFCPIFESDSNHRYNTGDYDKVDPMLGDQDDLERLCRKARELGMHVMLDGVFNHTGSNSRYFNAHGIYPSLGAAQSRESPYYPWYNFQDWPWRYDAWWGVRTLPAVNESHPDYVDFIITGEDSVIRRWLRAGADAWRLDVADELPDEFIAEIRRVMEEEKPDSFLLGEVWEDGSNKIAYDKRRKYLLGRETHGLMNYPFRDSCLRYLRGGPAEDFQEAMETIRENYPRPAFYSAMNMLGTHDTPRVLTLLGTSPMDPPATRKERAEYRMSAREYYRGVRLLQVGAIILFAFPGSPTILYGDEAGMEGWEDPFNRGTFPWGREDRLLQYRFALLGNTRKTRLSLRRGELRWLHARGHVLAFAREYQGEITIAAANVGEEPAILSFDWPGDLATDVLCGQRFLAYGGTLSICLPPLDGVLLI